MTADGAHDETTDDAESDGLAPAPRQRIERVSSRRARLTAVAGTETEPHEDADDAPVATGGDSGPNDARMRQDVPPHY